MVTRRARGFTLIEILLALSIVALLVSLALPRFFASLERSKEVALQDDLKTMRGTIDKFYADTGKYPDTLAQLVEKNYLRAVPVDPLTEAADTWVLVPPKNAEDRGIYDVKSGASGRTRAGTPYGEL